MRSFRKISLTAAAIVASTIFANAADIIPPIIEEGPPEVVTHTASGWYLRGDIGYAHMSTMGVDYYQGIPSLTGEFEDHDIGDSWMLGGGIGYQATDYFRVDVTANHYFDADFEGSSAEGVPCQNDPTSVCDYNDDASVSVTTLMANAYVDLGTYSNFTPYVGAGIGGAKMHWGDLENEEECVSGPCLGTRVGSDHDGSAQWRFAYALHAGVSYDLKSNLKLDAGYTYTHIEGGNMFDFEDGNANWGQQGFDGDMKIHAIRAGLRYQFGGSTPHYDNNVYK